MNNAPHMKPWPKVLQWLCGLIWHKDRNYADKKAHYAYCLRCGYLFGHPWKMHTWQELKANEDAAKRVAQRHRLATMGLRTVSISNDDDSRSR